MNALTKAPEYFLWSWTTILLCTAGWLSHWLMSWGKAWKRARLGLIAFVADNPPAFWLSLVAAGAFYAIGPQALPFFGIQLAALPEHQAATIANLGAFCLGFGADWLVYGLATILKRATGNDDPQP